MKTITLDINSLLLKSTLGASFSKSLLYDFDLAEIRSLLIATLT